MAAIVERWRDAATSACVNGRGAEYLPRSGQLDGRAFVLAHVDDVDPASAVKDGQVVMVAGKRQRDRAAGER